MELNVRSSHDCIVELTMICCQQNLPAKSDFPATLTEKEVIEEDGVEPRAKELSRRRSSSLQRRREKRGSEGRRFMWTFDEEQAFVD